MPATLKTIRATVGTDGTVRLREPIQLNESVEAVVTLLMGEDTDALATQEAVDMAGSKVFEKHDELFRKLAQ